MHFLKLFFYFFFALNFQTAKAEEIRPAGYGNVDTVEYFAKEHELQVSGWAASEKTNVFATNIIIEIDGIQIYRGRMLRSERPDVAHFYQRPEWVNSGFLVRMQLPDSVRGGNRRIETRARLGNGDIFTLAISPGLDRVDITPAPTPRPLIKAMIAMALLLPIAGLLLPFWLQSVPWIQRRLCSHASHLASFYACLVVSFTILVATGSSGSSLPLLFDHNVLAQHDGQHWLGENRGIRSDEWEVITPMAISQLAHTPPFPIVNQNFGLDGQNMLVTGMTGLPVAHASALGKPATWGFFVFDLKRALAWYWWMPIFGCFAALHCFLVRLLGLGMVAAAGLSAAFTLAPYSAGFSSWPAYTAFFPLACTLLAHKMLNTARIAVVLPAGMALGAALSGFALVLYPPWQISLATLFAIFFVSWTWTHRHEIQWRAAQWLGLATALMVSAAIMGTWWHDASDAIRAIQGTVYPGQRVLEVGGDIDPWFLLKGLLTPATMYQSNAWMDPSDAGSYILLPMAFFVSTGLVCWRTKNLAWVGAMLATYLSLVLAYMFIGSTPEIARWTLWGAVTSYRLDLALGMTQTMLWGWLIVSQRSQPIQAPRQGAGVCLGISAIAGITALATAALGLHLYSLMPPAIAHSINGPMLWASLIMSGTTAYLLITERHALALGIVCSWTLIAALPFNPLSIAPNQITKAPEISEAIHRLTPQKNRQGVAVIDERTWSLVLPMTGEAVANSVFYYPPASLWKRLDPDGKYTLTYNRYQRLLFRLGAVPGPDSYAISSPRLDEVELTLNAEHFDFRLLGVQTVLSPAQHAKALVQNASLQTITATQQWILLKVME